MTRLILIFMVLLIPYSWNVQGQSKKGSLTVETAITNDFNVNLAGGEEQGFSLLGNIDLILTLDTEKMGLWKGGSFFMYGLANYGNSLSELVGDIQGVNNIEANPNIRLYQFYYNHQFKNLDLTIGQHDLNSEFAVTEIGSSFIHSSFGIQPDISANVPVSIFPVATLGLIAKWKIANFSMLAAIYKGNPGSEEDNRNSVDWKFNRGEGIMSIVEFQHSSIKDSIVHSTHKLGLWNHSANVMAFDGQENYKNSQGVYFIGDYSLIREKTDPHQGLSAFVQVGFAPQRSNLIDYYTGFGLTYKGILPNWDEDVLGIAIGYASLNDSFKEDLIYDTNESFIELTYNTIISRNFSFQPDVQYVFNPGGLSALKNAFICSIRTKIEF